MDMTTTIAEFFSSITNNDYLTLFLVSIIPIVELRGALILAAGMDVNMIAAMFTCIAGSSVVIIPLILFIKPIIKKLKQTKFFNKIAVLAEDMMSDRADKVKKTSERGIVKKAGADTKKFWGLFTFVSIPLPLTGSWMGSCVGAALNFKVWKAALAILCGNVVAGGILTLMMTFIPLKYIDIVLYTFLAIAVFIFLCSLGIAIWKHEKRKKDDAVKHD